MSDIQNITTQVQGIALEVTQNGKNKYSLKLEQRFYSIWEFKKDGTNTKAWLKVKEIGSDNLLGKTFKFSFTEYHPEGVKYPYKTIIGLEEVGDVPTSQPAQSPDGKPATISSDLDMRLMNIENRLNKLEGLNSTTSTQNTLETPLEQRTDAPEPNFKEEVENLAGRTVDDMLKDKELNTDQIPF